MATKRAVLLATLASNVALSRHQNNASSPSDASDAHHGALAKCFSGGNSALSLYVKTAPSAQTTWEIFEGLWGAEPLPHSQQGAPLYYQRTSFDKASLPRLEQDNRVTWGTSKLFGNQLNGKRVLELGPMEAAHTHLLASMGAHVKAIEGNMVAYLKCLLVKEVSHVTNAEFLFGDFQAFLEQSATTPNPELYDMALAVGVLYHSQDPVGVISNLARITDRIVVWTHVYPTKKDCPLVNDASGKRFDPPQPMSSHGIAYTGYKQHYQSQTSHAYFLGGVEDFSIWLDRDGLVNTLRAAGFANVEIGPPALGDGIECHQNGGSHITLVAYK